MLHKTLPIAAGLVLALSMLAPAARADDHDQASRLTFDRSVEIPGKVLPAGTYWFVLGDDSANRNVVHVFDADRTTLLATVLTISAERGDTYIDSELQFVDRPNDTPKLIGWFYSDRAIGHRFVYDSEQAQLYSPEDVFSVIAQPNGE